MEKWCELFGTNMYVVSALAIGNKGTVETIGNFCKRYERSEDIRRRAKEHNLLATFLKLEEVGLDNVTIVDRLHAIVIVIEDIEKEMKAEYEQKCEEKQAEAAQAPQQPAVEQEMPVDEIEVEFVSRRPSH